MDAILLNIAGKGPKEFVFNSPTGSWWRHSSFYDRRWIPAIDDACSRGLTKRPRIHDLIDAIDRALTGSLRAVA
ncbi:hypothetical protein N5079_31480 [Planotetraspora sp. A-T 1434]|uniref:hypothetical protein n=1 Tax=Planotetraspora sp. A-T 1434 TaxID=2979219 RepID=UPI0021C14084|nr:hypothetical protein [Planotetraspora sp. A-T 1434]MCT9934739.1 hypothetical protein [Planotetraspora sp. A-T 1434]